MTEQGKIPELSRQLIDQLTTDERAELIERLITADRQHPLPPRAAGIVCSAGMQAVTRSVNTQTCDHSALDELGEVLFYGLDSFMVAFEAASYHAEGSRGHGPSGMWERAHFDALNLRDRVSAAVRKSHSWSDQLPTYIAELT